MFCIVIIYFKADGVALYFVGPRSTPFFNDSCSDTEIGGEMENLLQNSNENKKFIRVKEEIEMESSYFKCNNNNSAHAFQGKFSIVCLFALHS